MTRRITALCFLLAALTAHGQTTFASYQNKCVIGGQVVMTQGMSSTTKVEASYPGCTVSVYEAGTTTVATLYSTATGTPLSNPFTAANDGTFIFYATSASFPVDVTISGAGITTPYTFSNVGGATGGGGGGNYTPAQASTTQGTITGAIPGATFVLPSIPYAGTLTLAQNGQVLTVGTGYTISGTSFTVSLPLQVGDNLNANWLVAGGSTTYAPASASTQAGTITGAIPGAVFALPSAPAASSLVLSKNGQVLTPTLGYTISGSTITLGTALQTGDALNATYFTAP
jgi:hypothetical protein